ncbi:MAG: twin-arginine translocase TatA/TatE family subunit [Deltaproteobacteria bacterium]|nr:MAG: twin-arginine translocase TatA/TatE family subunit [Deltaproteobacteria bacterium]
MLGLSFGEILVIGLIALLVVGPDNLPQFARSMGRLYGQLRRTADELRRSLVIEADRQDAEVRLAELKARRERAEEQLRQAQEANPGVEAQPDPHRDEPPEPEVDPEYEAFLAAATGPYAAGRSLEDVAKEWRQAPRVTETDRPPSPLDSEPSVPERLPPGISPREWQELPPHIKSLLLERSPDQGEP